AVFPHHSYRNRRDLPSSPTRRSSDLRDFRGRRLTGGPLRLAGIQRLSDLLDPPVVGEPGAPSVGGERALLPRGCIQRKHERLLRSEEHTSELQSRENLVCRLLLEQKN